MQAYMTEHTYWDDVGFMLFGIAVMVVVLLGLCTAWAHKRLGWRQSANTDEVAYPLSGSFAARLLRASLFISSGASEFPERTVPVFRALASVVGSSLWRLIVASCVCVSARFAPEAQTAFCRRIFVEVACWLFNLAFRAGLRYDAFRHGLFLIKRLCSGPMTGYTPFSARSIIACLLLVSSLAGQSFAADDVHAFLPGVTTAYYLVRNDAGLVWYPVGQVFEAFGSGARTAADYDGTMTDKSADFFVGTFDTNISAGAYYVSVHNQVGGAPADTDPALWYDYGDWSGTAWIISSPSTIADATWDEATSAHTTETSFGGELGGLDPNLALVLADTAELQGDWTNGGRLDLLLDAVKAITDRLVLVTTTVASATDANDFVLTAGTDVNDIYEGATITVLDVTDGHYESRFITAWSDGARAITVDKPLGFTPVNGDGAWIWSVGYFPPNVYNGLPLPRVPETLIIDARPDAPSGSRTITLNEYGVEI